MTFRRPPATASWFLLHLSDPDEGLLGDLIEEYQRRQSPIWYWRQVAIAIVVGFARSFWSHKLETVQAVFTAASAMIVGVRVIIAPGMWLIGTLFGRGWAPPPASWASIFTWIDCALWFIVAAAAGALVARLHAKRRATMILATVMFVAAWHLPEFYRMAGNAITGGPRFLPYLVNGLAYFTTIAVGLFLGSLCMSGLSSAGRYDAPLEAAKKGE